MRKLLNPCQVISTRTPLGLYSKTQLMLLILAQKCEKMRCESRLTGTDNTVRMTGLDLCYQMVSRDQNIHTVNLPGHPALLPGSSLHLPPFYTIRCDWPGQNRDIGAVWQAVGKQGGGVQRGGLTQIELSGSGLHPKLLSGLIAAAFDHTGRDVIGGDVAYA